MNALNSSSKKLVWLAIACVLVVNAAILGKVFFNRAEVVATLQLSERELQLPYNYGFQKEDSSKRVSLRWMVLDSSSDVFEPAGFGWSYDRRLALSDSHFSSFQFPACEQNHHPYDKKEGWVLLELNGQSYADFVARIKRNYEHLQTLQPETNTELSEKALQEKRAGAKESLNAANNTVSRLFVIDAAAERELLEASLRTRATTTNATLVIVPAELQADYNRCDDPKKKITAVRINNLAVESLYISNDFLQGITLDSESHFTANVHYGRLNEPWIADLKVCEKDC
ncbi:MAG TPA: DUF4824 family protein [Cellvibrio sp.]|nr:DUF4824 family protein [Cellvibrio sp.]